MLQSARRVGLVGLLGLVLACEKTGSVEGDLYFALEGGDTRQVAATPILILREPEGVLEAYEEACRNPLAKVEFDSLTRLSTNSMQSEIEASEARIAELEGRHQDARHHKVLAEELAKLDTLAGDSLDRVFATMASRGEAVLMTRRLSEVRSDVRGHFVIPNLTVGRYGLYARTTLSERQVQWFATVEVSRGKEVKRDLDNSALLFVPCGRLPLVLGPEMRSTLPR